MKKTSIVLPQGTVINIPAGSHNVIKDGNTLYIGFLTVESTDSNDKDEPEPKPKKAVAPIEKAVEKVAENPIEKASKKVAPLVSKVEEDAVDFDAMPSDELLEFAHENGLDLAAYKKEKGISRLKGSTLKAAVKELYAKLDVADDEAEAEDEEEIEEVPAPKSKGGAVTAEKVLTILQKYEDEKLDENGLKKALTDLSNEKVAAEFTKEFLMNANLSLEEAADLFIESIAPKAAKEEAPKGKRGGKKEPKYEDVEDINELEVGDKVSVFWLEEEYNDTYTGHVSVVKKGKKGADNTVTIIYDEDGEAVVFDDTIHTDVKRLVA